MIIGIFDSGWKYTLDTPYNEPLGGTQSAICFFLEQMSLRGHQAYLFNKTNQIKSIRGVTHVPIDTYYNYIKNYNISFDIILVSCIPLELAQIKISLSNSKTLYGLWTGHDTDQEPSKHFEHEKIKDLVDIFIFVSNWQKNRYIVEYKIDETKCMVLRNGIAKTFEKYLDKPTNKKANSMTYCSIPWRGLKLLAPIFDKIKKDYSDATLKIFSGMNIYQQPDDGENYNLFKDMNGVDFNQGVSQTKLAEELYNIEYLTYPNIFPETSCITAIQAMSCGCLIVTSDLGALKETMGGLNILVDNPYDLETYLQNFVLKLEDLMNKTEEEKEQMRNKNREFVKNNYTYDIICNKFEKDIENIRITYDIFMSKYNEKIQNAQEFYKSNKYINSIQLLSNFKYFANINDYYTVVTNLGLSYYNLKQYNMSKKFLNISANIKDDFINNKNLAMIELEIGNIDKFIKHGKKALGLNFDTLLATLVAQNLELIGNYHESMGFYNAIIKLEPENIAAYNNIGNLHLMMISDDQDFDQTVQKTYTQALELSLKNNDQRKAELINSNIVFNNLYNWKLSEEEVFKRSCQWTSYMKKKKELNQIVSKINRNKINLSDNKKIRIGYISSDFMTHPVGYMFESILKNHNTDKFEIFCYDHSDETKSSNDPISLRLRSYKNAKWYQIFNKPDEELLDILVNDDLDLLVDMMGHTRNNRLYTLWYKPARIMVSYFAYPGTNGMDEFDWKFTDKYATPEECKQYYKEKLYYLPGGFQCYTPPVDIESTKNYSREKYKINLCCFNNPTKLSKPTLETFSNILKKLPDSKLYLRYCYYKSSYLKSLILKHFKDNGIDEDRIDIDYTSPVEALKLYNLMDIVLDPFPYNGGTISSEAIYMNTPLVTLEGKSYVSRVGVSLLCNLGLEKYIAKTIDEYVDIVVNLASNRSELKMLQQTLRFRMMNSDLANSINFTKNIENGYEYMIKEYNDSIN
jgi:predicted O-linked N-acetylglucosamine transferase (SPINDLY family)